MGRARKYDKPMTGGQRNKEYNDRLKALGYRRLYFWVHEDDVDLVKHKVKQIAEERDAENET